MYHIDHVTIKRFSLLNMAIIPEKISQILEKGVSKSI